MVISYIIHIVSRGCSSASTLATTYCCLELPRDTRVCSDTHTHIHTHIHTYTRISDVYLRIDLLYTDILVVTLIVITNYMVCIT